MKKTIATSFLLIMAELLITWILYIFRDMLNKIGWFIPFGVCFLIAGVIWSIDTVTKYKK
jgi:hypothetical protein